MNALKLTATENFMDAIPCDFWNTADDEYLVTREQIGRALGYSNPAKAIEKIHLKHKDRLDRFSCRIKSELSRSPQFGGGGNEGNGAIQERIFYNRKGIMEICRWSRQPVADEFMDWCYDIIENLIINKATSSNAPTISKETATQIAGATNNISRIAQLLTTITPPTLYSKWKTDVSIQIRHLASLMGNNTNDGIRTIYGEIYKTMREEYDMPVDKFKQQYIEKHDITYNPYAIDIVDDTPELKELSTKILNEKYIETTESSKY